MPELVDISRAAETLSVSTRTIYRLLDSDLPSVRIGRRRLIRTEMLSRYIRQREIAARG